MMSYPAINEGGVGQGDALAQDVVARHWAKVVRIALCVTYLVYFFWFYCIIITIISLFLFFLNYPYLNP